MTRKKNEKNSLANVLYANNEKMHPAYVSKHNSNPENQTILLMVPNGEGRHYIKNILSELSRRITLIHGELYLLNGLHSFQTENKRESHKKIC